VEGFKLKDLGVGGQSHNAQAIPSCWGMSVAKQSSDICSSAASQSEKQKTNNLKGPQQMDTADPLALPQGNQNARVPP